MNTAEIENEELKNYCLGENIPDVIKNDRLTDEEQLNAWKKWKERCSVENLLLADGESIESYKMEVRFYFYMIRIIWSKANYMMSKANLDYYSSCSAEYKNIFKTKFFDYFDNYMKGPMKRRRNVTYKDNVFLRAQIMKEKEGQEDNWRFIYYVVVGSPKRKLNGYLRDIIKDFIMFLKKEKEFQDLTNKKGFNRHLEPTKEEMLKFYQSLCLSKEEKILLMADYCKVAFSNKDLLAVLGKKERYVRDLHKELQKRISKNRDDYDCCGGFIRWTIYHELKKQPEGDYLRRLINKRINKK